MTQIESFKLPPSFNAYITDPISTLNPTSSINIFVGSNNSGKSRFLRMLSIQTRYEILIKEVSLTSIRSKISNILTEIRMLLSNQGLKEANEINEEFINKLIELPEFLNLNSDVFEPWRSAFKRWESLPAITKYVDKQGASLNSNRLEKFKEMLHYKSIEALQILDEIPIYSENIAPPKRVYIPVLRGLRPIDENLTDLYCIKTNHHYFSAVESGCNPPGSKLVCV